MRMKEATDRLCQSWEGEGSSSNHYLHFHSSNDYLIRKRKETQQSIDFRKEMPIIQVKPYKDSQGAFSAENYFKSPELLRLQGKANSPKAIEQFGRA